MRKLETFCKRALLPRTRKIVESTIKEGQPQLVRHSPFTSSDFTTRDLGFEVFTCFLLSTAFLDFDIVDTADSVLKFSRV